MAELGLLTLADVTVRHVSASVWPLRDAKLIDNRNRCQAIGMWYMQSRDGEVTSTSPAMRPVIIGGRRLLLAGLLGGGAALAIAAPQIPLDLTVAQLRMRIDDASAAAAKPLSPEARTERERSLTRFYNATAGLCGVPSGADDSCLHNEYYNYLVHIPSSVYRVDGHVVYETGVYGLLWADDNLQQQDPERAFTWDLRVTWPRVDEPADRSNPMWGQVNYALADEVHSRMSRWLIGGWELYLAVHLESLSRCYVSARIESSWYSGGAHPNEDFAAFNWLRSADRRLMDADLFRDGSNWRRGILDLYRKRLAAAADGLSDDVLAPSVDHGYVATSAGITLISHWGRSRAEPPLPDVVLTWADLRPWLSAMAPCTE